MGGLQMLHATLLGHPLHQWLLRHYPVFSKWSHWLVLVQQGCLGLSVSLPLSLHGIPKHQLLHLVIKIIIALIIQVFPLPSRLAVFLWMFSAIAALFPAKDNLAELVGILQVVGSGSGFNSLQGSSSRLEQSWMRNHTVKLKTLDLHWTEEGPVVLWPVVLLCGVVNNLIMLRMIEGKTGPIGPLILFIELHLLHFIYL